jgi:hypothetical protein
MKQVTSDIAKEKAMTTIAQNEVLAKIPAAELEAEIETFLEPVTKRLPEKRLKQVVNLAIREISGAQSPVVMQMARCLQRTKQGVWVMSKRFSGLPHEKSSSSWLLHSTCFFHSEKTSQVKGWRKDKSKVAGTYLLEAEKVRFSFSRY